MAGTDRAVSRAAASLGLEGEGADAAAALARMHERFARDQDETNDTLASDPSGGASSQPIPIARLRRLVKSDGTVASNLSTEMLTLLGRSTQAFVMDLTKRAAWFAHERKRRVLHGSDVVSGVDSDARYDFLVDVVAGLPGADEAAPDVIPAEMLRQAARAAPGSTAGTSAPPLAAGATVPAATGLRPELVPASGLPMTAGMLLPGLSLLEGLAPPAKRVARGPAGGDA